MKHIELFAGCGGMSLGLKSAGFDLFFANELSPMAAQTFAYNFLDEDISTLLKENKSIENSLWIKSSYSRENIIARLSENPFNNNKKYSDLNLETDLNCKLLIGDINNLLSYIIKSKKYKSIQQQDVDLISGGPPCQSFSLAGRRERNNEKNLLPLSFAKFVGLLRPKVVLLENVKGITIPFKENTDKFYAWLEVSKAFALEGYFPICMMINSKYYGVPQNRPRFIMLAYRKDFFEKLKLQYIDNESQEILLHTLSFYNKVKKYKKKLQEITVDDFKYFDIENDRSFFTGTLLPIPSKSKEDFISVSDAIDDLSQKKSLPSKYVVKINKQFKINKSTNILSNFEERKHNIITKSRFHYYQVVENLIGANKRDYYKLLSSKSYEKEVLSELFTMVKDFKFLIPNNKQFQLRKLIDINDFISLIEILKTKKRSQRALRKDFPAPAQLTIPDDICHYDETRTLTVREMARIQSFPDDFEFKAKVTTGGDMRKFEAPQYTQVGNAVPPLLALVLGELVKKQINDVYS